METPPRFLAACMRHAKRLGWRSDGEDQHVSLIPGAVLDVGVLVPVAEVDDNVFSLPLSRGGGEV